jgi:hypothetical protein
MFILNQVHYQKETTPTGGGFLLIMNPEHSHNTYNVIMEKDMKKDFLCKIILVLTAFSLCGCALFFDDPAGPTPRITPFPTYTSSPAPTAIPTTEPTDTSTTEPAESPTPEPTIDGTPSPTDLPTIEPSPAPTSIREMITPHLEAAAAAVEINECGDPSTPIIEDANTGYNVYVSNLQSASTNVSTQGDEADIHFAVYFNDVTGDIFFDCSCACLCLATDGDADGIMSADAFVVTGTITCSTDPGGDLVSSVITGMNVLVDNMSIETDNSLIDSFIADNIASFGAAYLPCMEELVLTAFSGALDTLLISKNTLVPGILSL